MKCSKGTDTRPVPKTIAIIRIATTCDPCKTRNILLDEMPTDSRSTLFFKYFMYK